MRAVTRRDVQPPSAIGGVDSPAGRELELLRQHFAQPEGEKPEFSVYKSSSVKKQLDMLFHGKCAYCESFFASTAPVDVEHYRPKGAVHEDPDHPGYWWLGMDWENLLPSCIDCNHKRKQFVPLLSPELSTLLEGPRGVNHGILISSGKKDSFPILGERVMTEDGVIDGEYPLLLDPGRDNPQEHLRFHLDREHLIGLVLPSTHSGAGLPAYPDTGADDATRSVIDQALSAGLSLKGAVSIHVYGLNRLGLVQQRTRLLRQLEFLEMLALEIGSMAQKLESDLEHSHKHAQRDFNILQRLHLLQSLILEEMKRMARPDAPYSVMVQAWIENFKARLLP